MVIDQGFIDFVKEYGFNGAIIAWLAWFIVIPLKERHMKFLDSVEQTNKGMIGTIEKQADILQGMTVTQNRMADTQTKMNQEIEKMSQIIESLAGVQIKNNS